MRRLKIDLEDLITLALELGPERAKAEVTTIQTEVERMCTIFDHLKENLSVSSFHTVLDQFDRIVQAVESTTWNGKFTATLATLRNLVAITQNGRVNLANLLTSFTSFLPSGVFGILKETLRSFLAFMGLVQSLRGVNPSALGRQMVWSIFGSAINRLLPVPLQNIQAVDVATVDLEGNLGAFGQGILTGVIQRTFGAQPATASVQLMDSLPGGFELPDGIALSEKHIRCRKPKPP
ncbi:hypothetical protein [Candidatus Caldatribacterium sp.]|uniref:hypothetical protein n=1 Tax=Candidatus Caldatribacterium sp. TaxID=2282143 RepID=UPI0038469EE3|nr:hypothetical protein [Candidatus Caldatribacterium sp.]